MIQRLHNKAKYKAQQKLPNWFSRSVSDKKYTQNPRGEKHKLNFWTWVDCGAACDGMIKSQLKKSILKFREYYEAKREEVPDKTS